MMTQAEVGAGEACVKVGQVCQTSQAKNPHCL